MPRPLSVLGLLPLALGLTGCPTVPEEAAEAAIKQAFEAANPPGRVGAEVLGKSVWLSAPFFEEECLTQNDLAFPDDPTKRPRSQKGLRISPTYKNQRYITGFTEKGWCIYMGSDPTLDLRKGEWKGDHWAYLGIVGLGEPSPWFQCLDYKTTHRELVVTKGEDGQPKVSGDIAMFDDACPHPLPGGEQRRGSSRPSARAPRAPSLDEVKGMLRDFDQALYDRDFEKALGMVSCYNVFEEQRYGSCSVAELINLGAMPRGGVARTEDGPPWTMNAFDSYDQLKRVFADRDDPSLFHVGIKPTRGDADRSLAVQWAGGAFKIVGVVGLLAEDLTSMRIVYDLDRKERRAIFERRMQGEPIDERGDPYDPYAEIRE
ncbi:MAG: hypothetical protein ABIO70_15770 [Pseudomonadota bacterium]